MWRIKRISCIYFYMQPFQDYYFAVVKPVRIEFKFNPATLVNTNHRLYNKLV